MRLTWPQRIFILLLGGVLMWSALRHRPAEHSPYGTLNRAMHMAVEPTFAGGLLLAALLIPRSKRK